MSQYPQTPVELVTQAVEEAKLRGASASVIDPVLQLVEQGSWGKAREVVDEAARRSPEACSNLRAKLSWASQWAQGRLPGTMQADLDNHLYSPEDIRDAWLTVISGGKYEPPKPEERRAPDEVVVRVDDTSEKGDNEPKEPEPPKGVEVKKAGDYSDIQAAIDKGIL